MDWPETVYTSLGSVSMRGVSARAMAAASCSIVAQAMAPAVPVVSQQALDSHYLQRALAHELPLPLATWHGTHNSFNVNNLTGLFFEVPHNQIYDIDAQLRYLGVRYIEIDVHYIPELTAGTNADRCVTRKGLRPAFPDQLSTSSLLRLRQQGQSLSRR